MLKCCALNHDFSSNAVLSCVVGVAAGMEMGIGVEAEIKLE